MTAVDWSPDGLLLATGCGDGGVRIFTRGGSLRMHLVGHKGGIFVVRWNKRGDLLVSCSLDGTVIVWEAKTGAQRQQMTHHRGAVLDMDWRNNTMFASSSQDGSIAVLKLGEAKPFRQWQVRGRWRVGRGSCGGGAVVAVAMRGRRVPAGGREAGVAGSAGTKGVGCGSSSVAGYVRAGCW